MYAVVKANAYGHGLPIIDALSEADGFAVATVAEAAQLAELTDKSILILGRAEDALLPANAIPSISSTDEIRTLRYNGWRGRVQIKVNTGMNRLGCRPETVRMLADCLAKAGMRIDGAFTHFYAADDADSAARQFTAFDDATRGLSVRRHCCASNGIYLPAQYRLDASRPGLALYGYGGQDLRPVMRATAAIVALHFVRRGDNVGYGIMPAPAAMIVATVACGYADGYRRCDRPRTVTVNGADCPVVGQVCMDMFFADVTHVRCRVGDEAVVLGDNAEQLAEAYGSIPYEVLTGFNRARGEYVYEE